MHLTTHIYNIIVIYETFKICDWNLHMCNITNSVVIISAHLLENMHALLRKE